MLNSIHERNMNKDENIKVKIWRYSGASSIDTDIISSLQKAPEQIKIPTGTNDTSNDTNYLENAKKIVKCKDTKLSFSSVICRNDIKHIIFTIIITNYHVENYCKQQNLGFIDNGNIKKPDVGSKGLHLHECDSSKLAKKSVRFYILVL